MRRREADQEQKHKKRAAPRGARVANLQSLAWVNQNVEGLAGF